MTLDWEILASSKVHSDNSSKEDKVQNTVCVEMWEQNTKQHPEMTGMYVCSSQKASKTI